MSRSPLRSFESMLLAFVGLLMVGCLAHLARAASEVAVPGRSRTRPLLTVETAAVAEVAGYRIERHYTGKVEPAQSSRLGFELGGLLVGLYVQEGERVDAAEPIARLDTSRLEAQKGEVRAALAEVGVELALAETTLGRVDSLRRQGALSDQANDNALARRDGLRARRDFLDAQLARIDDADNDRCVCSAAAVRGRGFLAVARSGAGGWCCRCDADGKPDGSGGIQAACGSWLRWGR